MLVIDASVEGRIIFRVHLEKRTPMSKALINWQPGTRASIPIVANRSLHRPKMLLYVPHAFVTCQFAFTDPS